MIIIDYVHFRYIVHDRYTYLKGMVFIHSKFEPTYLRLSCTFFLAFSITCEIMLPISYLDGQIYPICK